MRVECPLQALLLDWTGAADRLGLLDLIQGRARSSDRKEDVRVGNLPAVSPLPPVGLRGRARFQVERDFFHEELTFSHGRGQEGEYDGTVNSARPIFPFFSREVPFEVSDSCGLRSSFADGKELSLDDKPTA